MTKRTEKKIKSIYKKLPISIRISVGEMLGFIRYEDMDMNSYRYNG
ncbi:MAG: hypothetical protein N4A43_03535 [Alphaproteobacteria bacterium]|nr:hypothetical protein [Alphaproteobacteria bacterium]